MGFNPVDKTGWKNHNNTNNNNKTHDSEACFATTPMWLFGVALQDIWAHCWSWTRPVRTPKPPPWRVGSTGGHPPPFRWRAIAHRFTERKIMWKETQDSRSWSAVPCVTYVSRFRGTHARFDVVFPGNRGASFGERLLTRLLTAAMSAPLKVNLAAASAPSPSFSWTGSEPR